MEMSQYDNVEQMPLPEGRRGRPGAGAGSDSMRTTSGRELSRRASSRVTRTVTAEPSRESSCQHNAPPRESASRVEQPVTTELGLPRRRLKWLPSMNEAVMRSYFTVTKIETDMTLYRQKLHSEFSRIMPQYSHLSVGRIADQKNTILRRNLLSMPTLSRIKEEVRLLLENRTVTTATVSDNEADDFHSQSPTHVTSPRREFSRRSLINGSQAEEGDDVLTSKLKFSFNEAMLEFEGIAMERRCFIPKQKVTSYMVKITHIMDEHILPEMLHNLDTFEDLQNVIYCAAVSIVRNAGGKIFPKRSTNGDNQSSRENRCPPWEHRIVKRIDEIRKKLAWTTQFARGGRGKKIMKYVNSVTESLEGFDALEHTDLLRQKLAVQVGRLRRYKRARQRKMDNKNFDKNEQLFYKKLSTEKKISHKRPSAEETKQFWEETWAPKSLGIITNWIEDEEKTIANVPRMEEPEFTMEELTEVLKKMQNWKQPGLDNIQAYWLKRFKSLHLKLLGHVREFLINPNTLPKYITEGVTYLIPKKGDLNIPSNYRPVTCLSTTYKLVTALLNKAILKYMTENSIVADEQKACGNGNKGSKEALTIDNIILEQATKKSRNLYTAYIDYQKAFDSVSHEWLLKMLQTYKVHDTCIRFFESVMGNWQTYLVYDKNVHQFREPIPIRRGIYQGDSFSPVWFCLSINPLSHLLKRTGFGYNIGNAENRVLISHQLYMDDLKLYSSSSAHLHEMISIVEKYSRSIGLKFGFNKCRLQTVVKGTVSTVGFESDDGPEVRHMKENELYCYLGIKQGKRTNHSEIKKELRSEFKDRVVAIMKTGLNSKNLTKAINTFSIPLLTYSFGIIKWTSTDIDDLERAVRVLMTKYNYHHPKSSKERITLPWSEGGRRICDLKRLCNNQVNGLREYFLGKRTTSNFYQALCDADKNCTPLNLSRRQQLPELDHDRLKVVEWMSKRLHGRHPNELHDPDIDKNASLTYLKAGYLFPETEGFLHAIQDQVVKTRAYRKFILGEPLQTAACRKCGAVREDISHVLAGCTSMAQTEYKRRHDAVAKILHLALCQKYGLMNDDNIPPYYKYQPVPVTESEIVTLYWDRTILTDRTVAHNRPDITLVLRKEKKAYLLDVAVPLAGNMSGTYKEKISKYVPLAQQIKQLWGMDNVKILPFVLSPTALVHAELKSCLKELGLSENLHVAMQKAVILSVCSSVRSFLQL